MPHCLGGTFLINIEKVENIVLNNHKYRKHINLEQEETFYLKV